MSEDRFDAIIVGGGLAGCTAALLLAREGLEVLVVEKGNYSGAKNMTGGRLYGHSLEAILPGFAGEAPVERRIVQEKVTFLSARGTAQFAFASEGLKDPACASYAVLRGKFDNWLAEQAENEGAMFVYGVRVDELLRDETGAFCGIRAGDEEMEADVVILADGVNSLLAQRAGLKAELLPENTVVGVKEVFELTEEEVSARFGLAAGEGLAWSFLGAAPQKGLIDGFLYTNTDSISEGNNVRVSDRPGLDRTVVQLMDDFLARPEIAPLLAGAQLREYSAHLIPEGGLEQLPALYADGLLLTGDAAALVVNLGHTLRGMDLAIESGRLAAETVLAAREAGSFGQDALALYAQKLEDSFVMQALKKYGKGPHNSESAARALAWMEKLFVVDGSEAGLSLSQALDREGGAGA